MLLGATRGENGQVPVSRAAAAEMAERLLATEAEVAFLNMLLWGAAAGMGAVALTTRVVWARARNLYKGTIVALIRKAEANQAKIETARSACLERQTASIKNREKFLQITEELAREKKKSASAQAQVQLERSERLGLQMAYVQLSERFSKETKALQQEVDDFSVVTGAMMPLAFQALKTNLVKNKRQAQELLPRQ